jgi:type I restriction enzyme, S subunit
MSSKPKDSDPSSSRVPRLRFPEFREAGEWEKTLLGKLSAVGLSNGIFNDPKKVGTGYKLVNVSDMYIDSTINEKNLSLIQITTNEFLKNKVEHGDIFFTRSSLVKSGIAHSNIYLGNSDDITFDGHLIRFRPNKKIVFSIFVHYLLKTDYIREQLVSRGKTATMTTIGQADVAMVELDLPILLEQQKIADCLSSLDTLITAQSQKLEALEVYKKGLMQQLFPSEGETTPKLRFLEFREAGEWEELELVQLFPLIRNGFVGTATPYYTSDGIPYLQGKNIKDGQIDSTGLIRISNEFHQKQRKSQLKINDILMVQSGHVGECAVVSKDFVGSNCHALIVMSPAKDTVSVFFVYYFHSEVGISKIDRIKTGNTIAHILTSDLKAFMVHVPSLLEQQKIADCLSSLDQLISAQKQKLEALKTHKKGLMQQLFPSPDDAGTA